MSFFGFLISVRMLRAIKHKYLFTDPSMGSGHLKCNTNKNAIKTKYEKKKWMEFIYGRALLILHKLKTIFYG